MFQPFARLIEPPTRATTTAGKASTPNRTRPSGNNPKPPPLVSTMTTGWTSRTASPQRQVRIGQRADACPVIHAAIAPAA